MAWLQGGIFVGQNPEPASMDLEPGTFGFLDQPLLGSTPPEPGIYGPVKVQALSSSVAGATV